MIIVNVTRHPITAEQQEQIRALLEPVTGEPVASLRVVELPRLENDIPADHIADDQPLAPQVKRLVDAFDLSAADWLAAIIVPPSLAPVAATLTAELHGRLGHFPPIIRIQPVPDSVPRRYRVAELVDLQHVRDAARGAPGA